MVLAWKVRAFVFFHENYQLERQGLGSRNKHRMVKDFLRLENPDVVMIQETKKEKCDRRFVGSV